MILSTLAIAILSLAASPEVQTGDENPAVSAARGEYERVKAYLLKSAEQMPDSDYGYKPTAAVRTFGEIMWHLASTQYQFCAAARNEKGPEVVESANHLTTKAALVQALRGSFEYCDAAYAMTDVRALTAVSAANAGEQAPLSLLILNIGHDNEHYGNIVTYLRLNGLVPPSSQRRE